MRPVSACSSFKNQWPSRRHSVPAPPLWEALLTLPFPLSSQGSGGGRDEGSSAGSRLSEKEEELLLVVERLRICLGGGGEEVSAVGSPLSKESCPGGELMDWLALLTMIFFSKGLELLMWVMTGMSCVSESVSCFEAMLLERLSLKQNQMTLSFTKNTFFSEMHNTERENNELFNNPVSLTGTNRHCSVSSQSHFMLVNIDINKQDLSETGFC